jgi:hypothetical protein
VPKAFEFAEIFSKPADSNPLLLLDNRCLRVAPRAFENRQGATSPVLKSGKYVADEQFSFVKRTTQRPPLLEAGQWQSHRF